MATALKKQSGRQFPILAYFDFALANLTSGAGMAAIEVPAGAVIIDGYVAVTEVFNSTTSDVLDVGDATVANRYKNDINLQALGLTELVPTGYVYTAPTNILLGWVSGGGVPTTGKARAVIQYYVTGRAHFPQGLDS